MQKIRRFTILIFGVAITLAITGAVLSVLLPPLVKERSDTALASKARSTSEFIAAYTRLGLIQSDSAGVASATELSRMDRDLAFAVVVDDKDRVIASANERVAVGAEWSSHKAYLEGQNLAQSIIPIVIDGWMAARVHVAMSDTRIAAEAEVDRVFILGFGGFLMLLALGTGFGVLGMKKLRTTVEEWQQRHQVVRRHAGSLQSSVRVHRETEATLKVSEKKYKSLFENTMESAMRDLEEMNKHLEKRKGDLEHEVGVRKRAELALRRYTERLQVLNELERTLLEGSSVSESATVGLTRLDDVLRMRSVSLVDIDLRKGAVTLLGCRRKGESVPEADVPEAGLVDAGMVTGSFKHVRDIESMDAPSALEQQLLTAGAHSYGLIPLVVQDESVGCLIMTGSQPDELTDEHFSIARDVADLLAIGIHNARLDADRAQYEEELIAARDRAEDMARLKSAFLTNMSHEIRTPISGIMGFSQVLHEEVPSPLKEFTGLIQESAFRLLNTINSVLELARLESGRGAIEQVAMDLGEATESAIRMMEPAARRKGLDFRFERPTDAVWCYLDPACVERVVTNLVDNAIKFTDGGGVRVRVEKRDGNGRLIVSDTGVGIEESFLPQLFDEFRQEQMDANREHEGSGLGLTITKKLVDRLGGLMAVESRKGVGTTFSIDFPLLSKEASTEKVSDVLVVTANAQAGESIRSLLGSAYECTLVSSREQVASLIRTRSFDHAIADMNALSPSELRRVARALLDARPGMRLLALATQILPEDPDQVLEWGFAAFVRNAYAPGALVQALAGDAERHAERNSEADRVGAATVAAGAVGFAGAADRGPVEHKHVLRVPSRDATDR